MRWASSPSAASSGYRPPGRLARSKNRSTIAVTTIATSAPIATSAAVRANGNSDAAGSCTGADEDADEGAEPVAALPAVRSVPILMSLLDARGAHGSTFRPELGTQERRQERTPETSSTDRQRRLAGRH